MGKKKLEKLTLNKETIEEVSISRLNQHKGGFNLFSEGNCLHFTKPRKGQNGCYDGNTGAIPCADAR